MPHSLLSLYLPLPLCISQAVAMDTCNPDGCTSSMADDIFFVLQKCTRFVSWCCQWVELMIYCRRAFSSGNVDGACAVLNNARSAVSFLILLLPSTSFHPFSSSLLLTEFRNQLQLRLQTSPTTSTTLALIHLLTPSSPLTHSLDLTGMLQGKSRAPERRENEVGGASYMVGMVLSVNCIEVCFRWL